MAYPLRKVTLEQCLNDLRFAGRSLMRARGFSLAVIFTLAIGMGVATAVFNLTSWLLFYDLPYPNPSELYSIGYKDKQTPFVPGRTGLHFQAWQEQTNVFSEFAAVRREMANVIIDGEPAATEVLSVTGDTFHTLGLQPVLGRGFLPQEMRAGADNVAIISDLFWRQQFNANPEVLGHDAIINNQPCKVIGVMGADQQFPPAFKGAVYRPLVYTPDPQKVFDPWLYIIGRLKPGVTPDYARDALTGVKLPPIPQWAAAYFSEQQLVVMPLKDVGGRANPWVLFISAMLLFGIACLNAMNLTLVRLLGRAREMSIRLAIGGTRWQLARLVLCESIGLALAATALVALAMRWWFPPLVTLLNDDPAARYATYWTWHNLGFLTLLGVIATMVVVLVPIFRVSRSGINDGLKSGGPGSGESRTMGKIRNTLVIVQAALAVILLAGTGLMMRTFEKLNRVDLGFNPTGRVKVYVSFPRGSEPKPAERLQYFERLRQSVATIPGVKAVSASQDSLVVGAFAGTAQLKMSDGTFRPVAGNFVSADFQQTAGLTLKRGQWLSGKKGANEAVINETMARERFGNEDAIGQSFTIQVSGNRPYLVVGVVRDVREMVRSAAGMRFYVPDWMYPPNVSTLLLRLDRDPGKEFGGLVRHAIYKFDPNLITAYVTTVHEVVANTMRPERYTYMILRGLASIALGLAVVGLFAVIAYTVNSRTREFGVRLALGAQPANLHRLVLAKGILSTGVGIAIGTLSAVFLTQFMKSMLFETTPYDPAVYLAVAAVLLAATLVACWLPARRAAKVDPIIALRCE